MKEKMELGSFTLTAKQWAECTGAVGIQAKQGKNGGTFAHPDIAVDFRVWLEPELHLQRYLDEFCWRFNRRHRTDCIFFDLQG